MKDKISVLLMVIKSMTALFQDFSRSKNNDLDVDKYQALDPKLRQVISELSCLSSAVFYVFAKEAELLLDDSEKKMIKEVFEDIYNKIDPEQMLKHFSPSTTSQFFAIKKLLNDKNDEVH